MCRVRMQILQRFFVDGYIIFLMLFDKQVIFFCVYFIFWLKIMWFQLFLDRLYGLNLLCSFFVELYCVCKYYVLKEQFLLSLVRWLIKNYDVKIILNFEYYLGLQYIGYDYNGLCNIKRKNIKIVFIVYICLYSVCFKDFVYVIGWLMISKWEILNLVV